MMEGSHVSYSKVTELGRDIPLPFRQDVPQMAKSVLGVTSFQKNLGIALCWLAWPSAQVYSGFSFFWLDTKEKGGGSSGSRGCFEEESVLNMPLSHLLEETRHAPGVRFNISLLRLFICSHNEKSM